MPENASHTPGPLHTVEYETPYAETRYAVNRGSETLATGIRKEADAKLYAAAPDLLAAAKRAEAALAIHGASNCEAAKECRAAIAKATGNSQDAPAPAPGTDATTADGRFVSGSGYGGERM